MTEIDESLLEEGIFLSRLHSYFPHLNFSGLDRAHSRHDVDLIYNYSEHSTKFSKQTLKNV